MSPREFAVLNSLRAITFWRIEQRDIDVAVAVTAALPVNIAMFTCLTIEPGGFPRSRHVSFATSREFGITGNVFDSLEAEALQRQAAHLVRRWKQEFLDRVKPIGSWDCGETVGQLIEKAIAETGVVPKWAANNPWAEKRNA